MKDNSNEKESLLALSFSHFLSPSLSLVGTALVFMEWAEEVQVGKSNPHILATTFAPLAVASAQCQALSMGLGVFSWTLSMVLGVYW